MSWPLVESPNTFSKKTDTYAGHMKKSNYLNGNISNMAQLNRRKLLSPLLQRNPKVKIRKQGCHHCYQNQLKCLCAVERTEINWYTYMVKCDILAACFTFFGIFQEYSMKYSIFHNFGIFACFTIFFRIFPEYSIFQKSARKSCWEAIMDYSIFQKTIKILLRLKILIFHVTMGAKTIVLRKIWNISCSKGR